MGEPLTREEVGELWREFVLELAEMCEEQAKDARALSRAAKQFGNDEARFEARGVARAYLSLATTLRESLIERGML